MKTWTQKVITLLGKYRYAIVILVIGLALMMIPGKQEEIPVIPEQSQQNLGATPEEQLDKILESIKGAGRVEVLLSYAAGEKILYQTDTDSGGQRMDTVTVTDRDRNQTGLVTQVVPAVYQGAVIVCQGGGNPTVRLAIVEAVSKYTGLGSNQIAVLEMK